MTDATDVLLVGGPANGRMWCVKRPAPATITSISEPVGDLLYPIRKFWNVYTERWYWIGTRDEDGLTDDDIAFEIQQADFPPAWDLATLPAPASEPQT